MGLLRSKRPACSERCTLDLPGFKNLEGLPIGLFPALSGTGLQTPSGPGPGNAEPQLGF